jgi:hypothetical protein
VKGMMRRLRVLPHDREIGVGAPAWRARALSLDQKIGVGAMAWRARFVSRDPKIGIEVRVWRLRVLPHDPGSGGPVRWVQEPGAGGCRESGGRCGEAAGAGLAGDVGAAPVTRRRTPPA